MNDLLWMASITVIGFVVMAFALQFKLKALGFAGAAMLIIVGALLAQTGLSYQTGVEETYNVTNVLTWNAGNLTYVQAVGTTTEAPVYTNWLDIYSGGLGVLLIVIGFYFMVLVFSQQRVEVEED